MSLYDELGVASNATAEEIKAAYRRKARETHPDAGGDAETFRRVQTAYDVLSDAEKRQRYDRDGVVFDDAAGVPTAAEIVSRALTDMLTQLADGSQSIEQLDIPRSILGHLAQVTTQIRRGLAARRRKLSEVERLLKRMKRTDGTEPVLERVLEAWMRPLTLGIETDETWLRRLGEADALMRGYSDLGPGHGENFVLEFVTRACAEAKRKQQRGTKRRRAA
jgi:curved DNA-binding protein CbpA